MAASGRRKSSTGRQHRRRDGAEDEDGEDSGKDDDDGEDNEDGVRFELCEIFS